MLLFCHINLVKFENFLLSKILGMTYNLKWREYFIRNSYFIPVSSNKIFIPKNGICTTLSHVHGPFSPSFALALNLN